MSSSTASQDPKTLALPRILCLHGGGVNARVFRMQCRALITRLAPAFRLVFVDAPFQCPPHDAIVSVYGDLPPFYRWLRFQAYHPEIDASRAAAAIVSRLRSALEADPGSGPWAAVLGFSQGAKIAASLLWAQDYLREHGAAPLLPGVDFRFGVLMAGSAPVVTLDNSGQAPVPRHVESAGEPSSAFEDWPESNNGDHVVRVPTLHVHGLQDPGIDRHRTLLESYCKAGTTRLVEWDGNHRLPIKTADVELVVSQMLELAKETGVL